MRWQRVLDIVVSDVRRWISVERSQLRELKSPINYNEALCLSVAFW